MSGVDDSLLERVRLKSVSKGELSIAHIASERRQPASYDIVVKVEQLLNVELDPLLKRVYLEVTNGGFGPGYGALSLTGDRSLPATYSEFRNGGGWPEMLLPIWDWGDAVWSCVDRSGRIITHDDVGKPTLTDFDVRSWLQSWVDGVDLWKELYDDQDALIPNPFTRKAVKTTVRGTAKGRPWTNVL